MHTSLASLVPTKLTPDAGVTGRASGTILMLRVKYTVFLDGVRHRRTGTRGREHTYEAYNVLTKYKLRVYMSTVARTSKDSVLVLTEGCAEPTFWRRWCGEIAWGRTAHRAEWF